MELWSTSLGKTSEDEDYPKHLWHVWDNILDQLVNILWNHCIPLFVHHLHLLVCHYPGLAHRELCHLLHHPCICICTDFIARDLASFWGFPPHWLVTPQNGSVKNLRDAYLGEGNHPQTIYQNLWKKQNWKKWMAISLFGGMTFGLVSYNDLGQKLGSCRDLVHERLEMKKCPRYIDEKRVIY